MLLLLGSIGSPLKVDHTTLLRLGVRERPKVEAQRKRKPRVELQMERSCQQSALVSSGRIYFFFLQDISILISRQDQEVSRSRYGLGRRDQLGGTILSLRPTTIPNQTKSAPGTPPLSPDQY